MCTVIYTYVKQFHAADIIAKLSACGSVKFAADNVHCSLVLQQTYEVDRLGINISVNGVLTHMTIFIANTPMHDIIGKLHYFLIDPAIAIQIQRWLNTTSFNIGQLWNNPTSKCMTLH